MKGSLPYELARIAQRVIDAPLWKRLIFAGAVLSLAAAFVEATEGSIPSLVAWYVLCIGCFWLTSQPGVDR